MIRTGFEAHHAVAVVKNKPDFGFSLTKKSWKNTENVSPRIALKRRFAWAKLPVRKYRVWITSTHLGLANLMVDAALEDRTWESARRAPCSYLTPHSTIIYATACEYVCIALQPLTVTAGTM